jgi:hypothetical protein
MGGGRGISEEVRWVAGDSCWADEGREVKGGSEDARSEGKNNSNS